jgi:hypothetical protein
MMKAEFIARALAILSNVHDPYTIAGIGAFFILVLCVRKRLHPSVYWAAIISIAVLSGLTLAAFTYLSSQGVYHIRITVLALDSRPVDDAEVSSSVGGEIKHSKNIWELDIARQAKPSDGIVTIYASDVKAFLVGQTKVSLGRDFFRSAVIQMQHAPFGQLRGMVVDENNLAVPSAKVAVVGSQQVALSDEMGNFTLSVEAANDQLVTIHAEKGDLLAEQQAIVGKDVKLVLRTQRKQL